MFYPQMNIHSRSRTVTDTFAGYDHNLKIADGVRTGRNAVPLELYDDTNLSTRQYPLLTTRQRRGTLDKTFTNLQAIIAKDALYWVDNGTLYANGVATGLTGLQTTVPTTLVSMGAYICVFPDKKYINTAKLTDYGGMETVFNYTGDLTYTMCHADGEYYTNVVKSDTAPENPLNGDVWIDTKSGSVSEYSSWQFSWVVIETVYTRVDFTTQGSIPSHFKEHDGVQVTGLQFDDLNGSKILYAVGGSGETGSEENDFVVLVGIQEMQTQETGATVTIKRAVPDMDYVCEANNRLWGCRYGNDGTQNLNEIYCCALGDFKNWEQYLGVSTDSWRGSCGSDGPFTGCINYLGNPTFFKENMIHTVSVSSVGAHQIQDMPARGVQQGSHKSLAVVNETLFYKSRSGVMAYQGGMPADLGEVFGDEKYYAAVAGVFGHRYYISMKTSANVWHLFCYDAKAGLWMREDNLHAEEFAAWGDALYVRCGNAVLDLNGTEGAREEPLEWVAETGIMFTVYPDRKYVSRYDLRMKMEAGAKVQLYIEYDSSGLWEFQGEMRMPRTNTAMIPVRPRRCDHLRLRLEGKGEVSLFSIARNTEQGSDAR